MESITQIAKEVEFMSRTIKKLNFILFLSNFLWLLISCDLSVEIPTSFSSAVTEKPEETASPSINVVFEYFEDISTDHLRNISIKYPQVSGLENVDFQTELNEKLKMPYYSEYDDNNRLTMEIWSEYACFGGSVFSFQFHMFYHHLDAAHPFSNMWAVNVNLETGEYLDLSDIGRVEENIKELILSGQFVSDRFSYYEPIDLERIDGLSESVCGFYLTDETLGIISSVSHAAGDYWTLEIPYAAIGDLLDNDFKLLIGFR